MIEPGPPLHPDDVQLVRIVEEKIGLTFHNKYVRLRTASCYFAPLACSLRTSRACRSLMERFRVVAVMAGGGGW